ncbi:hypothetical protein [Endozoicomonas sp. ALE010]|uniref:hypothetical protein n=1 Tax=Endozoicomonas sp. ALE010 TaxID=3403081 RepID=UPI003BB6DFAF
MNNNQINKKLMYGLPTYFSRIYRVIYGMITGNISAGMVNGGADWCKNRTLQFNKTHGQSPGFSVNPTIKAAV